MKMKKEDIVRGLGLTQKTDTVASHVRNKVSPINDTAQIMSNKNEKFDNAEKKEKSKAEKMKTISRMKELLKKAAAAQAEKGGKYISRKVLYFRNITALKAVPNDDQLSNDSPKISFRWDLESCSTMNSSAISMASSSLKTDQKRNVASMNSTPLHVRDQSIARTGSWITTDADFVVLEL